MHRRVGRYGNNRIFSELQSHGIKSEMSDEVKQELTQGECARACEVLRRKFALAPPDAQAQAKCQRFLQQRGFSHRAIQAAIKIAWNDDEYDAD